MRKTFLFLIFLGLLAYFLIFSIRSPIKNETFPIVFQGVAGTISAKVGEQENTHIIYFKDGRKVKANLVKEAGDSYDIHGGFGNSGSIEYSVKKSDIDKIEPIILTDAPVAANEIIAKQTFPK